MDGVRHILRANMAERVLASGAFLRLTGERLGRTNGRRLLGALVTSAGRTERVD